MVRSLQRERWANTKADIEKKDDIDGDEHHQNNDKTTEDATYNLNRTLADQGKLAPASFAVVAAAVE